jgi:lipopolysaccharide transport system ATP-binding protein
VLAVGDAEFQEKALGKMKDVSKELGRTVLFVSHNMQAISTLTKNSLILDKGNIKFNGLTSEAINHYFSGSQNRDNVYVSEPKTNFPNITKVFINTSNEGQIHICGEKLEVQIELNVPFPLRGASLSFQIINSRETPVVHLWTFDSEREMCRSIGLWNLICEIPTARLYMGEYSLKLFFTGPPGGETYDIIEGVCPFKVVMFKIKREFQFQPETCAYLEDANWKINKSLNEGTN